MLKVESDGMDVDDGVVGEQFMCQGCARKTCGMCAVVGETRLCLQCATSGRNASRAW